ncbi:hypothetical protein Cyrtocomes_00278 [Candidatus Cyrtobacter comes]|uniref:Uncharacterized protein n=1 Tax=Candidatus Cyrtobacter comes TaxID=675776 RepID=A0ABU5L720_9RICK|nr:hypothetical protein [Candidatus Cyrtobacter comes]MDZ5761918.1 hypothetical protein [Candidatus Cyrtobacter comes]
MTKLSGGLGTTSSVSSDSGKGSVIGEGSVISEGGLEEVSLFVAHQTLSNGTKLPSFKVEEVSVDAWVSFKKNWPDGYLKSVTEAKKKFSDAKITRKVFILVPLREYFAKITKGDQVINNEYLINEFITRFDALIYFLLEQYAGIDGAGTVIEKLIDMRSKLSDFPELLYGCCLSGKETIHIAPFNELCAGLDNILGTKGVGASRFIKDGNLKFSSEGPEVFDPIVNSVKSQINTLRGMYIKLKVYEASNEIATMIVTTVLTICHLISSGIDMASKSLSYGAEQGKRLVSSVSSWKAKTAMNTVEDGSRGK